MASHTPAGPRLGLAIVPEYRGGTQHTARSTRTNGTDSGISVGMQCCEPATPCLFSVAVTALLGPACLAAGCAPVFSKHQQCPVIRRILPHQTRVVEVPACAEGGSTVRVVAAVLVLVESRRHTHLAVWNPLLPGSRPPPALAQAGPDEHAGSLLKTACPPPHSQRHVSLIAQVEKDGPQGAVGRRHPVLIAHKHALQEGATAAVALWLGLSTPGGGVGAVRRRRCVVRSCLLCAGNRHRGQMLAGVAWLRVQQPA